MVSVLLLHGWPMFVNEVELKSTVCNILCLDQEDLFSWSPFQSFHCLRKSSAHVFHHGF